MAKRKYNIIINDKTSGEARKRITPSRQDDTPSVITDRGVYVGAETYGAGDRVIHNGVVWTAAIAVKPGEEPTFGGTKWQYVGVVDAKDVVVSASVNPHILTPKVTAHLYCTLSIAGKDVTRQTVDGWSVTTESDGVTVRRAYDTKEPWFYAVRAGDNITPSVASVHVTHTVYGGDKTVHLLLLPAKPTLQQLEGVLPSVTATEDKELIRLLDNLIRDERDRLEQLARADADAKEKRAREAALAEVEKQRKALQAELERVKTSGTADTATLTALITEVNKTLGKMQDQIDGEVSNWFYPGRPAPDKAPESEWTTNGLKARHIGDTYTSTDESGEYMGKSWRYTTKYTWQEIHDTLVSKALATASKAQTTADGKSTTYLHKPTAYSEGDSWVLERAQTVNGHAYEAGTILFATADSPAYVEAHWQDKVRYIGATQLRASEAKSKQAWEQYATAKAQAERTKAEAYADGKVSNEETARINAVNRAVQAAKQYAEAQDALLKQQAETYADGKVTESERAQLEVMQAKANHAEAEAKAYADGKVSKAEEKAINKAQEAYDNAVRRAEDVEARLQAQLDEINVNPPRINAQGNWEVYRFANGEGSYVDTGRPSVGDDGKAPKIVDGYWYEWDGTQYTNTEVRAIAQDGKDGRDGKDAAQPTVTKIDASALDQNTYYPVTILLSTAKPTHITVQTLLGDCKTEWSTHAIGYSCYCEWTATGSGWGSAYINRNIIKYSDDFVKAIPLGELSQVSWASQEYIYVRGGGYYTFTVTPQDPNLKGATAEFRPNGYLYEYGQYRWELPIKRSVSKIKTDLEVKQEQIAALGNEVNKANSSVTALKTYTDGAFRDSVISEAESKQIELLIKEVEGSWSIAEGAYNKVVTNPLLVGSTKRSLEQWKVTLKGARDGLTSYIRAAIADKIIPPHESKEVARRYDTYNDTLKSFQSSLKEAERAIVDEAQVADGRNLLTNSAKEINFNGYGHAIGDITDLESFRKGGVYTLTVWGEFGAGDDGLYFNNSLVDKSGKEIGYPVFTIIGAEHKVAPGVYSKTVAVYPANFGPLFRVYGYPIKQKHGGPLRITKIKLERGSVATPWTEAPEDIEARRQAQIADIKSGLSSATTLIDTLKKATKALEDKSLTEADLPDLQWLLDALNNGKTTTAGGLVLSKIIALSNQVDRITAYLSGYDGDGDGKILRAGIKYTEAKTETREVVDKEYNLSFLEEMEKAWKTSPDGFKAKYREEYGEDTPDFRALAGMSGQRYNLWVRQSTGKRMRWFLERQTLTPYERKSHYLLTKRGNVSEWRITCADVHTETVTTPAGDTGEEHTYIKHDGSARFGDMRIESNGRVLVYDAEHKDSWDSLEMDPRTGLGLRSGVYETVLTSKSLHIGRSYNRFRYIDGEQFYITGLPAKSVCLPGVIAAGKVSPPANSYKNSWENYIYYGAMAATKPAEEIDDRTVRIPHRVGHTAYTVLCTTTSAEKNSRQRLYKIVEKSEYYVDIYITTPSETTVAQYAREPFDYVIVGNTSGG